VDDLIERLRNMDGEQDSSFLRLDAIAELDRLTEMVDQLTHFIETNPVQLVADLRRELAEARELLREIREDAVYFGMPTDRIDAAMAEPKEVPRG